MNTENVEAFKEGLDLVKKLIDVKALPEQEEETGPSSNISNWTPTDSTKEINLSDSPISEEEFKSILEKFDKALQQEIESSGTSTTSVVLPVLQLIRAVIPLLL